MTVSDIYAVARAELQRRAESDKQLNKLLDKIHSGKATFEDTAAYNERFSNLLGETLAKYIAEPDSTGANESACIQLLTEQHGNINALLAEVQRAMDKELGLNLNPIQPKFPAERVKQIANALEDMTVPFDVLQRRANAPVANVSKAFHDAYMKENAKFRSSAGIKCYLNRQAHGSCCPWCSAIVGRYVYGDHPDDIFRRHDNCSCTVTFENGRQRQDVWSKRTWEVPDKDAGADEQTVFDDTNRPAGFQATVLSPEQAKTLQERLTNGSGSGTMETVSSFNPLSASSVVPILRRESSEWISSLTSEEIRAIQKYTKNSGDTADDRFFARLNAMLRGELPEDNTLRYYAGQISSALQKNILQHDIVCYRKIDFDAYRDFDVGEIFQELQFTSTSVKETGSLHKPFSVVIQCPSGTNGAYIELLSKFPNQREFLIANDVWYRVVEKRDNAIALEVLIRGQ